MYAPMNTKRYKQCELTHYVDGGVIEKLITYIPYKFAVLNKELHVEDQPEIWVVTWVSEFEVDMLPDVNSTIKR
jgi:hypothetical protein